MNEIELVQRVHTGLYEHLDIKVRGYGEGVDIDACFDALNKCLDRIKYKPNTKTQ